MAAAKALGETKKFALLQWTKCNNLGKIERSMTFVHKRFALCNKCYFKGTQTRHLRIEVL